MELDNKIVGCGKDQICGKKLQKNKDKNITGKDLERCRADFGANLEKVKTFC